MGRTEERTTKNKDRARENIQANHQRENTKKIKNRSLTKRQDNNKRSNISVTGVPEEDKENTAEKVFEEIMAKNFQIWQEGKKTTNKINRRKTMQRYSKVKLGKTKDKENILKASRTTILPFREVQGEDIPMTTNFSPETMGATRHNLFQKIKRTFSPEFYIQQK